MWKVFCNVAGLAGAGIADLLAEYWDIIIFAILLLVVWMAMPA